MGLFDFLSDGLNIKREGVGNISLGLLVCIPTLIFALSSARAFLIALDTSGGFGDTILNGIMPALMVWIGRYFRKWDSQYSLPGGKLSLTLILFFSIASIGIEIVNLFHLI